VVPLFIDQIRRFNKITLTCGTMTRYFLTLAEAITLLFKAAEFSSGGETFVMNMPSFHLSDLVKVLISYYGNDLTSIEEIGIREGEKMHEVLISEHESARSYVFDSDYYVIMPEIKIAKDYEYISSKEKVNFEKFSSMDNIKSEEYLTELLNKGGFLV